ncbi:hypothetical protein [Nannocystis radixulma]|uniref:Uncharacterized protein n=1 Tax=Nannocystis radixulma TaxID=2995305 RepID=A0ABT5BEE3_9BACT|nr:hypothetical protein [Nannocystis radixulma]MDC0671965.1 hypothetical protein [Nannocystis radixulma]
MSHADLARASRGPRRPAIPRGPRPQGREPDPRADDRVGERTRADDRASPRADARVEARVDDPPRERTRADAHVEARVDDPPASAPAPTEGPAPGPKLPAPSSVKPSGTGPMGPASPDNPAALGMRRMRDGTVLYIDSARRFSASFNDDGTVRIFNRRGRDQHGRWMPLATRWELRQKGLTAIGISGPIEWLLWLQHRLGGPELHASAKTAFMARTAEARTRMRIAWTLRVLDDRFNFLNRELTDLWTAPGRETAARRELLFQRWDECDEAFAVSPEVGSDIGSPVDEAFVTSCTIDGGSAVVSVDLCCEPPTTVSGIPDGTRKMCMEAGTAAQMLAECEADAQTNVDRYTSGFWTTQDYITHWGDPCPVGTSIVPNSQFYVANSCNPLPNVGAGCAGPGSFNYEFQAGVLCQ